MNHSTCGPALVGGAPIDLVRPGASRVDVSNDFERGLQQVSRNLIGQLPPIGSTPPPTQASTPPPTLIPATTALPPLDLSPYRAAMKPEFAAEVEQFATAPQYQIDLTVASDLSSYTAAQQVRYTNTETEPLPEIYFSLFANLPSYGGELQVRFFHYLDADADGSIGGDTGERLADRVLSFVDGDTLGLYRGWGIAHFQVGPAPTIRNLLIDGLPTELDDSGTPFGPGDWSAAWQWTVVMPAGSPIVQYDEVKVSSHVARCTIKGDLDGNGMADLLALPHKHLHPIPSPGPPGLR